jgi:predicted GH43/DUF377 family glycosyl hydrolase
VLHILAQLEDYERFGKVPNVIFGCGSAVLNRLFCLLRRRRKRSMRGT